jgi:hypothetical protein
MESTWKITDNQNGTYLISVTGTNADGTPLEPFDIEHTSSECPTPGQVFLLIAQAIQKSVGGNDAK